MKDIKELDADVRGRREKLGGVEGGRHNQDILYERKYPFSIR